MPNSIFIIIMDRLMRALRLFCASTCGYCSSMFSSNKPAKSATPVPPSVAEEYEIIPDQSREPKAPPAHEEKWEATFEAWNRPGKDKEPAEKHEEKTPAIPVSAEPNIAELRKKIVGSEPDDPATDKKKASVGIENV